jgi:apolipoprotein N-acyltransferase
VARNRHSGANVGAGLAESPYFQAVFDFCNRHPHLLLLTGIDSYRSYGMHSPGTFSVRQLSDGTYYEAFNTAMAVGRQQRFALYHKSKLVPGVETLPSWLGFLGKWFDEFGGISGSLGKNDSAVVFTANGNPFTIAPIICYESIYSDYVTNYVRQNANLLTIITNDGWWGNTPGYKQHMHYARLRAVESGLWVARSANTGISCFISPTGEVLMPQAWDTQSAIKLAISPTKPQTFYAQHGDWLSRLCWPLALLLPAVAFATRWWKPGTK